MQHVSIIFMQSLLVSEPRLSNIQFLKNQNTNRFWQISIRFSFKDSWLQSPNLSHNYIKKETRMVYDHVPLGCHSKEKCNQFKLAFVKMTTNQNWCLVVDFWQLACDVQPFSLLVVNKAAKQPCWPYPFCMAPLQGKVKACFRIRFFKCQQNVSPVKS